MPRIHLLILSAGHGSRFGSEKPKQYHTLLDKTVLDWTLLPFLTIKEIDSISVVYSPNDPFIHKYFDVYNIVNFMPYGGETRANSVLNGLLQLSASDDDWVLVHDAARCCVNPLDIKSLINTLWSDGVGGILAQKATDTIKYSHNGFIEKTINRNHIFMAQTPQMFRFKKLKDALQCGSLINITDEASAVEFMGLNVKIVEAKYPNFKITYPDDLEYAGFILAKSKEL